MKMTKFMLAGAVTALMLTTACSSKTSESTEAEATDSIATAVQQDSVAVTETPAMEEAPEPEAKVSDKKVDEIIAIYNEHIETVQSIMDNGLSLASTPAVRALSGLPDPDAAYNKIKDDLTPEQKARIAEVQKKLEALIAQCN